METLKYEELIAPGEIKDFPVSMKSNYNPNVFLTVICKLMLSVMSEH